MKADRQRLATRTLAELAWQRWASDLRELSVDVVTAVPMHRWRRWQRGVNPPRRSGRADRPDELGVPAAGRHAAAVRNIPPQIGLSRPARFRNVAGEMAVRPGYHLEAAHVLLVDDILTTGATCQRSGPRAASAPAPSEVTVFVLARTPADG